MFCLCVRFLGSIVNSARTEMVQMLYQNQKAIISIIARDNVRFWRPLVKMSSVLLYTDVEVLAQLQDGCSFGDEINNTRSIKSNNLMEAFTLKYSWSYWTELARPPHSMKVLLNLTRAFMRGVCMFSDGWAPSSARGSSHSQNTCCSN